MHCRSPAAGFERSLFQGIWRHQGLPVESPAQAAKVVLPHEPSQGRQQDHRGVQMSKGVVATSAISSQLLGRLSQFRVRPKRSCYMPNQSFCLDRAITTNRERSAINRKTCDPSAGRSNSRAFDASHQNSRLQAALNFNQLFTAECANARSRAPLSTASVTGPASVNISRSPSLAKATCRISTIKATHYLAFCKCAKGGCRSI